MFKRKSQRWIIGKGQSNEADKTRNTERKYHLAWESQDTTGCVLQRILRVCHAKCLLGFNTHERKWEEATLVRGRNSSVIEIQRIFRQPSGCFGANFAHQSCPFSGWNDWAFVCCLLNYEMWATPARAWPWKRLASIAEADLEGTEWRSW